MLKCLCRILQMRGSAGDNKWYNIVRIFRLQSLTRQSRNISSAQKLFLQQIIIITTSKDICFQFINAQLNQAIFFKSGFIFLLLIITLFSQEKCWSKSIPPPNFAYPFCFRFDIERQYSLSKLFLNVRNESRA